MTSLDSIPALRGLSAGALDAIARDSTQVRFAADTVIRQPGCSTTNVLLLLSGTVVAFYNGPSGNEVWPASWDGPAIVDKPTVLAGGTSSTGLVARTACVGRLLPRGSFMRLLEEQQTVRSHVLNRLSQDALASQNRLAEAVTLPAVAQIAAWLNARDRTRAVAWRGSQQDLARALGLSRVTTNRALQQLARAGAIRLLPVGITIIDRPCLARFTDGSA